MSVAAFLYKNLSKVLDIWKTNAYNNRADMALNASWIEPDAIGGRENNV